MAQPTPIFVGLDVHKDRSRWPTRKASAPIRPCSSGRSGPDKRISTNGFGVCRRRRRPSCSRTRPARAATGCIAT